MVIGAKDDQTTGARSIFMVAVLQEHRPTAGGGGASAPGDIATTRVCAHTGSLITSCIDPGRSATPTAPPSWIEQLQPRELLSAAAALEGSRRLRGRRRARSRPPRNCSGARSCCSATAVACWMLPWHKTINERACIHGARCCCMMDRAAPSARMHDPGGWATRAGGVQGACLVPCRVRFAWIARPAASRMQVAVREAGTPSEHAGGEA